MSLNYKRIVEIAKTSAVLNSINNILEWDQETYMPPEGISIRSAQIEAMATIVHKSKTSPRFAKALAKLIDLNTGNYLDASLTQEQKGALREWRRDYLKQAKLPAAFVKKFAKVTSNAIHEWSLAKEKNRFKDFEPHLEKIVALCRKKADYLGFKDHPYDALLDLYEPQMTQAFLTPLFSKLKDPLKKLILSCKEPPHDFLFKHFCPSKQMAFGQMVLRKMGFNPRSYRLDQSSHPFCMGIHPKDTRMTTKVLLDYFPACLFAVIHEGGHGLYNMGLKEEHYGTPLSEPVSLGIDESQSRWWETRIGKSLPFWKHFFPILQEYFPEELKNVTLDAFYRAINLVKPSLVRIEADEVTYNLHIIVRFEIEKALIEGSLKVKDLPEAWNAKMQEYLGLTPPNDAEGCLQDIHWSMGGIGYFPTYTLGNLYAAQFFLAFEKAHPDWKEKVAQGQLEFVKKWLNENIHQYGRLYSPEELVLKVTGSPLSEKPFVNYLEAKFRE